MAAPVPAAPPPAAGAPRPSPTTRSQTQIQQETEQALVKQIVKDHHVTTSEARRRADRQPPSSAGVQDPQDLGAAYGGAWIDQEHGGKLTIGVTKATKATAAPKARTTAKASGMSDTSTTTVKYSFRHLQQVSAALAKRVAKANKGTENGLQTGIITSRNVVKLNSLRGAALTPAQKDVLRWAEHQFGDAVQTGTYAHKSVPKYCYDDYACDPPLRSGLAIFTSGALHQRVHHLPGGQYYMLTAYHCAEIGYWWDVSTYSYGYQNVGGVANSPSAGTATPRSSRSTTRAGGSRAAGCSTPRPSTAARATTSADTSASRARPPATPAGRSPRSTPPSPTRTGRSPHDLEHRLRWPR